MTRREKHRRYEFVKLCSALTKQGFHFNPCSTIKNALSFPKHEFDWLTHPDTKTPFVDALRLVGLHKNVITIQFIQWADKEIK